MHEASIQVVRRASSCVKVKSQAVKHTRNTCRLFSGPRRQWGLFVPVARIAYRGRGIEACSTARCKAAAAGRQERLHGCVCVCVGEGAWCVFYSSLVCRIFMCQLSFMHVLMRTVTKKVKSVHVV